MSESSKHSASIGQLAQAAGGLLDDLLHADRLDLALQLVDAVYKAVASEDAQTRKDWFQRRSDVQAAHPRWQEYRKAQAQLETMPDDPQANLLVGRRMCFVLGQWDRGLMHLARGSDDALRQLADADLNSGDDLDAAQTMADQWRAAAGRGDREPAEQISMLRRCREHLNRALEMSRGTDREKEIDDRLQAVDQQLAALEAVDSGDASASVAQFALEFDGQDDALVTNLRYDGSLPITIEAIVKPAAYGGFVVGNNDQSGVGIALDSQLRRWAWVCRSKTPNQFVLCYSDDEAVLGRWVHLAGVYAGGAIAFFVDGKLQGQVKQIGAHLPSKQAFLVGANPRPDGKPELFFHGAVRELRVSATPLYRRDFTPPKTLDRGQPTVLLYRLNEGQGATAADTSGNRWDGQILGAQWVKLSE